VNGRIRKVIVIQQNQLSPNLLDNWRKINIFDGAKCATLVLHLDPSVDGSWRVERVCRRGSARWRAGSGEVTEQEHMAHDRGAHGHHHAAGESSRMLAVALGLTTAFLIAELIGSILFNSLALLSDAARMFTDSAALAASAWPALHYGSQGG
jgi:hypothetical protein